MVVGLAFGIAYRLSGSLLVVIMIYSLWNIIFS
ncbi:hypothetical protein [Metabacillus arenae]